MRIGTAGLLIAAGLALAGPALAQDKPAQPTSQSATVLEVAGVKAAIGVAVTPAPAGQSAAPLPVDDRTVVSPDEPAKAKKGK